MKIPFTTLFAALMVPGVALADMEAQVTSPWDGVRVPAGQHCALQGGQGATPPIQVTGIPDGTVMIVAEYNDRSYQPLSRNGGHGTLGYPVSGSSANLPSVPGVSANLPHGVIVVRAARGTGQYASPGYLPPCSGGRGNQYSVDLKAVDASGQVLETLRRVRLGRY
ncbi:hypothetical protein [Cochlodiniinecator piscidefendens]|uniref:hypothetical protein n=1 Tax=Cochlodiniinecator piscidefendens TaxID=2715756 RepID=UPI001E47A557|nr:hypothetical protein [Cochlodiniinecator piscidefendens]